MSGSASTGVVNNTSLRSAASPTRAAGGLLSHRASRAVTRGVSAKFQAGGGEAVAHSRVEAPQGSDPAAGPRRRLTTTLMMKIATLSAIMTAPALAMAF